jgi:hypothetical protein
MDIFIKNGVIKKREQVQQNINKKAYDTEFKPEEPGPYYDPYKNHCHVWKSVKLIQNFSGEQKQNELKIKKSHIPARGIYCSICHIKLKSQRYNFSSDIPVCIPFKRRKEICDISDAMKKVKLSKIPVNILWDRFYVMVEKANIEKYRRVYNSVLNILSKKKDILNRWSRLTKKLTEPFIYYQISAFNSIYIKLSEMTPYQIFRYKNPDYRVNNSFIIHDNNYDKDYVVIA